MSDSRANPEENPVSPDLSSTVAGCAKQPGEGCHGEQHDPMIGATVGQYTIKRVIGSGGMGTVYEAIQKSPRRTVALKMMKQGISTRKALRRFEYEAQTLGRLRHENIAQIYEAGSHDDGTGASPFFAMEYITGAKSLTEYAADKKLGTRERLALFSKVCDAVQHGHQKGIIHRDLKPHNILVTSSGVPKIIDFGVARSTDSDLAVTTLQTDIGALIGTLQYMSPEQCAADPNDIDTRSDVYALGVILFELLCETLPYDVAGVAIVEAARVVQQEEPTKPSTVDRRLRGDIETIALKALEKDRDRRYQTAVELEQDINRYLAGDPIAARPPGAWDYLRRFARKYKAATAAILSILIVVLVAAMAISAYSTDAWNKELHRRDQTDLANASESILRSQLRGLHRYRSSSEEPNKKLIMALLANGVEDVESTIENSRTRCRMLALFGNAYMEVGEYDRADALLQESMEISEREERLYGQLPIRRMGRLRMRQGRYAEAERFFREALEVERSNLQESMKEPFFHSSRHRRVLDMVDNEIGPALMHQEKYEEAERHFLEALEGKISWLDRPTNGTKPSWHTRRNLADLYLRSGEFAKAIPHLDVVLQWRVEEDNSGWRAVRPRGQMGYALQMLGRFEEAEEYYLLGLEPRRWFSNTVLDDRGLQGVIIGLIELYVVWDRPEEAEKYRQLLTNTEQISEHDIFERRAWSVGGVKALW